MAWLRLDDGYDTNPKLLELTEVQRWRWSRALLHCARHKTDGHITAGALRELGLGNAIKQLVAIELLHMEESGFVIHDWADYNPKDPTKTERQRRWRASTTASTEPSTRRHQVDTPTVPKTSTRTQARAPVPVPSIETRAVTPTRDAARDEFQPNSPDLQDIDQFLKAMP